MGSILDGMPKGPKDVEAALGIAGRLTEGLLARSDLGPRGRSIAKLLGEGLSMADILGITPDEREAVLRSALRSLQVGDFAAARDILVGLVRLEPMDRRAAYALGVAQQGCGDIADAGKTYVYAMALDATDPEPYLRLGECLLANGERVQAYGCFEAAKGLVEQGYGTPSALAHAERMLEPLADIAAGG